MAFLELRHVGFILLPLSLLLFNNFPHAKGEDQQVIRVLLSQDYGGIEGTNNTFLRQLLEHSKGQKYKFVFTNFTYSDPNFITTCQKKLLDSCDACLIMKSSAAQGVLTEDILLLAPTLVFLTPQNRTQSNFTHIFHSSVWSFLLVAIIVCCALLVAFEYAYPFGFRLQYFWNLSDEKRLNAGDAVSFVIGSLFLKTPSKRPLSPAGNILALTWSAFSLCFVSLFIAGTVATVFAKAAAPSRIDGELPNSHSFSIVSPPGDIFFDLVRRMPCREVQSERCAFLKSLKPKTATFDQSLQQMLGSDTIALLTDSFVASQLLKTHTNLSAALLGPPIASLAFRAVSAATQHQLNRNILQLRETGLVSGDPLAGLRSDQGGDGASFDAIFAFMAKALPIHLSLTIGIFILLLSGIVLAFITLISEFLMRTLIRKDHKKLTNNEATNPLPNQFEVQNKLTAL